MSRRSSIAFAPAAITNFFEISYNSSPHPIGATGGGYILSKGTRTKATMITGGESTVSTKVNGDEGYNARTTRRAVELFRTECKAGGELRLEQTVETPIGSGFGASAASATSAVYAAAAAARIPRSKEELALFAHRAEIIEQTGLGTVSVVYDAVGAGAITVPGEPGKAEFVTVRVPNDVRIVTAFLAPYDKKEALSSKTMSARINLLGGEALQGFLSDPTLESLAAEGEEFSRKLGLETPEIKRLIALAKSRGATHASQNMIGYAIHSLVHKDDSARLAAAFRDYSREVRVDVFEVGRRKAGVLKSSRRSRGPS